MICEKGVNLVAFDSFVHLWWHPVVQLLDQDLIFLLKLSYFLHQVLKIFEKLCDWLLMFTINLELIIDVLWFIAIDVKLVIFTFIFLLDESRNPILFNHRRNFTIELIEKLMSVLQKNLSILFQFSDFLHIMFDALNLTLKLNFVLFFFEKFFLFFL